MKTLEDILVQYFGAKAPVFDSRGRLKCVKEYNKLIEMLNALCELGVIKDNINEITAELDRICDEGAEEENPPHINTELAKGPFMCVTSVDRVNILCVIDMIEQNTVKKADLVRNVDMVQIREINTDGETAIDVFLYSGKTVYANYTLTSKREPEKVCEMRNYALMCFLAKEDD